MPAILYRFARLTWETMQARTVCRTSSFSNGEYCSPLRSRIATTLGAARRTASSTVNPLTPRL